MVPGHLFESVLETLPNPVFVKDEAHRWVLLNDAYCRFMGLPRERLLGKSDHDFFPESEARVFWSKDDAVFRTGELNENEERFTDSSGRRHVILTRKSLHVDADGSRWLVGVITDITDRKDVEEELRRSRDELDVRVRERTAELERLNAQLEEESRRKTEFLGVLSHELRNPLAPVLNALELLDRAAPGSERAGAARAVIGRQVGHLTRLVDDLLDLTRISRGKVHLRRERLDLADAVRRAVEDHRPLLDARGVALELRGPDRPLAVDADPTRIAQIIGNLLQNAAKFTAPGGRVRVTVDAAPDRRARIRVEDTGIGITPAMLGRLFHPFTQADESLHRSSGGLGLGLALVKGLALLHGGDVSARSAGTGRGAEFEVLLPLVSEAASAAGSGPPPPRPTRRRVLVIEDNVDAAETLRLLLEMGEHEVAVAHDGVTGLARARAFRPDLILCDLGLPGMDGYAVARAIRADPALAAVDLVAISGYALPDDRRAALEAGFDAHLAKPVPLDRLEDALRTRRR
ncbi:hybrid sensor histidine kinase/response regulator [Anaeromyxobacter oryzae]|uniref:histidine kinase n=1 Tax=Anaeromyxobacter oryzae TaxID=2918170 RepID=A0ABN6N0E6_9BACT|nr:ATP-binding protein [Anaeromyxobacter oryzae]BDG05482.1 hypothetical protein AMOR_44780 [Anaeromyxobacter oryzae]